MEEVAESQIGKGKVIYPSIFCLQETMMLVPISWKATLQYVINNVRNIHVHWSSNPHSVNPL